jgi:hypothetical protein
LAKVNKQFQQPINNPTIALVQLEIGIKPISPSASIFLETRLRNELHYRRIFL